jgi:hypothetical protein
MGRRPPTTNTTLRLDDVDWLLLQAGLDPLGICLRKPQSFRAMFKSPETADSLWERARRQHWTPTVASYLRKHHLPVDPRLNIELEAFRVSNAVQMTDLATVIRGLNARGILPLIMKGVDFVHRFYPRVPVRGYRDIDIFVRPEDVSIVGEVIREAGFKCSKSDEAQIREFVMTVPELPDYHKHTRAESLDRYSSHLLATHADTFPLRAGLQQARSSIDVHFNLSLEIDLDDVWGYVQQVEFVGGRIFVAEPTDVLWYCGMRLYLEVMSYEDPLLRTFVDLVALVSKAASEVNWRRLVETIDKYGMHPGFYYVGRQLNAMVPEAIPGWVIDHCNLWRAANRGTNLQPPDDWGDFFHRMFGCRLVDLVRA